MAATPIPTPLRGRFVVLTPLVVATDTDELFAISHADERASAIFTYLQSGPFETAQAFRAYYQDWCASPAVLAYLVRSAASAEAQGTLSLMNIRPEHGVAEIGHVWYSPAAQRTRVNTESVYLLLRHCFDDLGYRRIEWKCDTRNRRSGEAALRLGFSFEGVFRKHMMVRGNNRDTAWFSMLDDDWPARRDALEAWLSDPDAAPLSRVHDTRLPYPS
ncbi:MAG: GNAT family N-acetyltransferase [Planctomycetaceae bacterium]